MILAPRLNQKSNDRRELRGCEAPTAMNKQHLKRLTGIESCTCGSVGSTQMKSDVPLQIDLGGSTHMLRKSRRMLKKPTRTKLVDF